MGVSEWIGPSLGVITAMLVASGLAGFVAVAARGYDSAAGRAPGRKAPTGDKPEAVPDDGLVTEIP